MIVCDSDINYGSFLLVDLLDHIINHGFNCLRTFFGNIHHSDTGYLLIKVSHGIAKQITLMDF
jgi:hypothetical protein